MNDTTAKKLLFENCILLSIHTSPFSLKMTPGGLHH